MQTSLHVWRVAPVADKHGATLCVYVLTTARQLDPDRATTQICLLFLDHLRVELQPQQESGAVSKRLRLNPAEHPPAAVAEEPLLRFQDSLVAALDAVDAPHSICPQGVHDLADDTLPLQRHEQL